jgi:hypothetical protein
MKCYGCFILYIVCMIANIVQAVYDALVLLGHAWQDIQGNFT